MKMIQIKMNVQNSKEQVKTKNLNKLLQNPILKNLTNLCTANQDEYGDDDDDDDGDGDDDDDDEDDL